MTEPSKPPPADPAPAPAPAADEAVSPPRDGSTHPPVPGVIPLEDEATGYAPVVEGEESYDRLRLPHERDEATDPPLPPGEPPGKPR